MASLPSNVHVSQHPCVGAKISQLRAKTTNPTDVKNLVHQISLMLATEALATNVSTATGGTDVSPLGFEYQQVGTSPSSLCIIPILRSGLGMVDAVQTILPAPARVHHLGIYREPSTLAPVEYYNNLPNNSDPKTGPTAPDLAIIVDPIIATGGTCVAAIQTLREWGAKKVLVLSIVGHHEGIQRCAQEWPGNTEFWLAAVDTELTTDGMLKPGVGDIGDRMFLTG